MNDISNRQPDAGSGQSSGRASTLVLYSTICGATALLSLCGMVISPITVLLADAAILFSFLNKNNPAYGRHATLGMVLAIISLIFVALEYLILININSALQDPSVAREFYALLEQIGINQLP